MFYFILCIGVSIHICIYIYMIISIIILNTLRGYLRTGCGPRCFADIYIYISVLYIYIYIYICIIYIYITHIHIYTHIYMYIMCVNDMFMEISSGASGRRRFSAKTHRKHALFLQESPRISRNLWEITGECNLGVKRNYYYYYHHHHHHHYYCYY